VSAVVARPRLLRGLPLVVVAVAASVLAYVLQGLGFADAVPSDVTLFAVLFGVTAVAGWAAVRWLAPRADPILYPVAVLLSGLGLAMLFRLMVARGHPEIAQNQAIWLGVGLLCLIAVLWFVKDVRQLDAFTYTIGLAGVILLLLPVLPGIGEVVNGARLWVRFGPIAFQPAEFGRVLIVIFLASYLAAKRELLAEGVGRWGLPRAKDLGPLLMAWGLSLAVLFLERDMGASLLLFGVFVVMLWVATGRPAYLWIGGLLFVLGALLGYLAFSHVQDRVDYWLHALDPATVHDIGYGQLAQSWFALASGGMVGTGLGQGSPTLIPYVGSDFIFSAFGEELGMLGTSALLLLYLVLVGRGLRIGVDQGNPFAKLLAVGITATLALQTFVIVAGVTRLIPLTGVPLPLVSYGGTSKVATFVMLGLLLRTSSGERT